MVKKNKKNYAKFSRKICRNLLTGKKKFDIINTLSLLAIVNCGRNPEGGASNGKGKRNLRVDGYLQH